MFIQLPLTSWLNECKRSQQTRLLVSSYLCTAHICLLLISVYWYLCTAHICVLLISVYCSYLCTAHICVLLISVYCSYLCTAHICVLIWANLCFRITLGTFNIGKWCINKNQNTEEFNSLKWRRQSTCKCFVHKKCLAQKQMNCRVSRVRKCPLLLFFTVSLVLFSCNLLWKIQGKS